MLFVLFYQQLCGLIRSSRPSALASRSTADRKTCATRVLPGGLLRACDACGRDRNENSPGARVDRSTPALFFHPGFARLPPAALLSMIFLHGPPYQCWSGWHYFDWTRRATCARCGHLSVYSVNSPISVDLALLHDFRNIQYVTNPSIVDFLLSFSALNFLIAHRLGCVSAASTSTRTSSNTVYH